jgi:hypothetical protein
MKTAQEFPSYADWAANLATFRIPPDISTHRFAQEVEHCLHVGHDATQPSPRGCEQ